MNKTHKLDFTWPCHLQSTQSSKQVSKFQQMELQVPSPRKKMIAFSECDQHGKIPKLLLVCHCFFYLRLCYGHIGYKMTLQGQRTAGIRQAGISLKLSLPIIFFVSNKLGSVLTRHFEGNYCFNQQKDKNNLKNTRNTIWWNHMVFTLFIKHISGIVSWGCEYYSNFIFS